MAILKVARLGHPILRQKAKPVDKAEILTPAFQGFIQDMTDTMKEYEGVGLAAPQVHRSQRVSVVQLPMGFEEEGVSNASGSQLYVFINPELKALTKEKNAYWEGCLSVPGLRGLVARPNKVQVRYLNEKGEQKEITASGFLATVLQHEFDHLDGILYVDKLVDSTKLMFDQEFDRFHASPDTPVAE